MIAKGAAAITLVVLMSLLVAAMVTVIPWRTTVATDVNDRVTTDVGDDFSAEEIAAGDSLAARLRVPGLTGLAVGLAVVCLLGFWSYGARLVQAVAQPMGGAWWAQVLFGGLAVLILVRLATLPFAAWAEAIRHDVGLSTRSWGSWVVDVLKGFGINTALTLVAALCLIWLARTLPTWWWAAAGAGAAVLVVGVSFLYPIVIEPVFNSFTPMAAGPLRSSLLELAERDGVAVDDVLVADASRRTTTLNAYVSGFGQSRRIVVYDTLLEQAPPAEVQNVVAHELGHAKQDDVLKGTLLAALAAAAAVVALALLMSWMPLLRHAGVDGMADGRVVPLLLALLAVVSLLVAPIQNLASRRVEARADVHALQLTRDPTTLTQLQRRLALTAQADLTPNPLLFAWFGSHPSTVQRLTMAREWAKANGEPVPPPLSPDRVSEAG